MFVDVCCVCVRVLRRCESAIIYVNIYVIMSEWLTFVNNALSLAAASAALQDAALAIYGCEFN